MLKLSKVLLPLSRLTRQQMYRFSNEMEENKQKSYVMPSRDINKDTTVYTDRPVHFKNGRHLIYMNKQNLSTPFLLGLHYTIPLTYMGYLIVTNPFYLTFPAALPMLLIAQTVLLLFWIQHKSLHKRQVQRIYLLYPGNQFQIVYANKIRRYVKSNDEQTVHNVVDFQPKYDHQIPMGKVRPYPGVRFPADPDQPLATARKPNPIQYGWSFRDKTFNTYVIPAKYDYAQQFFLNKILNGIPVICKNATHQGQYGQKNYPKIEQEQKNVQKLKQSKDNPWKQGDKPKQENENKH